MKRRDFLKLIGAVIIAPGTVVAAAKVEPRLTKKEILLQKFRQAFKNTKFKKPMNTKLIIIYDEFDYITVNFLKKYKINIKHD